MQNKALELAPEKDFDITKVSTSFVILSCLVFILISGILTYLNSSIYLILLSLGIPFTYLIFKYPKFWIISVFMVFPYFAIDQESGVSSSDVLIGLYYFGTLVIWFAYSLIIAKRRIIYGISDFLLILFFILVPLNYIIANENNITFLDWSREFTRNSFILFYFPIRHHFFKEKDLKFFLLAFILIVAFLDVTQLVRYYLHFKKDVIYAYQIASNERWNQLLFTCVVLGTLTFIFFTKSKLLKFIFAGVCFLTLVALIFTFSRTFWVIVIAETIVLFFFLTRKNKINLIVFFILFSISLSSLGYVIFKDKFVYVVKFLDKRFNSTTQGKKDVSVQARLDEWEKASFYIKQFPLGGRGYNAYYLHNTAIQRTTVYYSMIHNGFMHMTYRLGFPMAFIYIFVCIYLMINSFILLFRHEKYSFFWVLSLACFLGLLAFIPANMTSPQFFYRDNFFTMAILYACTSLSQLHYEKQEKEQALKQLTAV